MKGPALKIVKTSAKFCCHLYSRGCEAERQLAVGGGSRHGAQPWAGRGGSEDCSCSGGCIAVTAWGCVRGGGRHHHPAQHPATRHPVVDLRTSVGARPGTAPVLPLSSRLSVPAPRRPALASRSHCPAICENMCPSGYFWS